MFMKNLISKLVTIALVLAISVVMLGAYTRLTNAGLGCPDWPGCYGHMVLPSDSAVLSTAQQFYPDTPVESLKAWTEMGHRYAAGVLAVLIFTLLILTLRFSKRLKLPRAIPQVLALLVIFQALLGMWTVTLKLLPLVVMSHLMGGILIFSLLATYRLQIASVCVEKAGLLRFWIGLGALILFFQIALGGWVSSNYAGIACIGFPACNGQWWPTLDFSKGFHLLSPIGENYQGGVLPSDARITVQFMHRLGALWTFIYWFILSLIIQYRTANRAMINLARGLLCLLFLQVGLGIINVLYVLPLWASVAHNGVAACLMAMAFMLVYLAKRRSVHVD